MASEAPTASGCDGHWATPPPPDLAGNPLLSQLLIQAQRLLVSIDFAHAELSVVLCDDPHIQALNRDHRQIDRPTDVLSFAMQEGEGQLDDDPVLGDLVISIDTARRQAAELGHSLDHELRVLLVHGLLHLLGYDHETSSTDAEEMRTAEQKLLARLGDAESGLIDRVQTPSGVTGLPTA
ncbi:MAG: rRNA maturation RNase YbeY [Deltaproteobacteria bacterium]|nr:rRNA maturation RNase YbeY [Deltaproteobacteria bacterium]HCH63261.1 rRNA maturation RNase YbeY [Deltaproteobacteria bacterium]